MQLQNHLPRTKCCLKASRKHLLPDSLLWELSERQHTPHPREIGLTPPLISWDLSHFFIGGAPPEKCLSLVLLPRSSTATSAKHEVFTFTEILHCIFSFPGSVRQGRSGKVRLQLSPTFDLLIDVLITHQWCPNINRFYKTNRSLQRACQCGSNPLPDVLYFNNDTNLYEHQMFFNGE